MYSVFSLTSKLNPVVLSRLMELQQWREMSFGKWIAPEFIKQSGRNISTPIQPGGLSWMFRRPAPVPDPSARERLDALLEALDDQDEVQNVSSNLPE